VKPNRKKCSNRRKKEIEENIKEYLRDKNYSNRKNKI
jgi:hypothetical protein